MLPAGAGQRRFSFTRMMGNMFPAFGQAREVPDALTSAELDGLFDFQISLQEPKKLGPASLYLMDIGDERTSRKVVEKLESLGILINGKQSIAKDVDRTDRYQAMTVDTSKLASGLTHHLAILPAWRQKRLIVTLFAWEEELTRWRLLEEEEREICIVMDEETRAGGEQRIGHLEKRLMELQGLARLKPSLRARRESAINAEEILPGYEDLEARPAA